MTNLRRFESPPWSVLARSEIGLVRRRLEDAYAVLLGAALAGLPMHAFAVFDGLGGMPRGQEAAQAAVANLAAAMRAAAGAEGVLAALGPAVAATGGATTATVALFPGDGRGEGHLLSVGDSAAYALDPAGRLALLNVRDSAGGGAVTDYLGRPGARGHAVPLALPAGRSLLLCTDGVDGVAPRAGLERVLRAPPATAEAALGSLFLELNDLGAPDNATALLCHRAAGARV